MTEYSWYWADNAVGDGILSPYDNDEFSDIWRKLFTLDRTSQGVIEDYEDVLAVTNPAGTTIRVASGAALVDGKFYENDDNDDTALVAPTVATRIDRVVLRKDWAAQTVRIAFLTGVEGGGVPALTQNDGVLWEIPLAQISITTVPAITITDEREFCRTPLAQEGTSAFVSIETLTGDGTSAVLDFQNIPQTYKHLFFIGQIRQTGAVIDADVNVRLNNDGGANYNEQSIKGANAVASATAAAGQTEGCVGTYPGANATANHAGQILLRIANYVGTTFYKTIISTFMSIPNNTLNNFDVGEWGVIWLNSAAVTRVTLLASSGNFATGTTVTLFGES